jgi:hypothetical protein
MNKLILIGIGIASVGLIALPQTLALFAGQHNFYEIDASSPNYGVPCGKCHADVYSELSGSKVHENVECKDCHIIALTRNGAEVGGNKDIHAAAAPACLDCHGSTNNYTTAPIATSILNGANESHIEFASNASSAELLKGANEACIGCHTHVIVNITWQKPTNLSFKASVSTQGVWNVTDFTAGGVKETKTTGNATGNGSIVP